MECMSFTCVSVVCLSMMAIVGVYSQCERGSGTEGKTECLSSIDFRNRKYQAAVCMRRSTLKSKGLQCEDRSAKYCWYYCSFTPNNPGFSVCECDPDKNPSALTSAVPLSCYTPDGKDCSWYRRCLETRIPCESTAHPYAITYAEKYCKKYGDNYNKFSENGRKWVDAVRKCLQESLVHVMFPQINISCKNVKERAFSTHTDCYLKPSNEIELHDLSIVDCLWIFRTVKGAYREDFFGTLHESWSVIKQYVATKYLHNAVKRLELFIRNAASDVCDEMAISLAKGLASNQKWSSDIMYYSYCPKRSASQLEPIPIDIIIGHETNDEAKVNRVINILKEGASDGSLKTLTLEDEHITEIEKIKDCIDPECKSASFVVETANVACTKKGGYCRNKSLPCDRYESGLCDGAEGHQCCIPINAEDLPCVKKGGWCQQTDLECDRYESGLCGGSASRKCCVPHAECTTVTIIKRKGWGAKEPTEIEYLEDSVGLFFIHHTDTGSCNTIATCAKKLRSIQRYHMTDKDRKYSDIGYSFLVGNDGNVYEGRGWSRVGAHTKSFNSVSLAASFIGNFTEQLPSTAALNAAKNLIQCGIDHGYIKPSYTLLGHRDVGTTTCPGNKLYEEIKKWKHYKSTPYM